MGFYLNKDFSFVKVMGAFCCGETVQHPGPYNGSPVNGQSTFEFSFVQREPPVSTPDPETKRQQMLAAAERRQNEFERKGVLNPESVRRHKKFRRKCSEQKEIECLTL